MTRLWVGKVLCLHKNGHCMFQNLPCPSSFSSEPQRVSLCLVKSVSFFLIILRQKKISIYFCSVLLLWSLYFYGNSFESGLNYCNCSKPRINWFYFTVSLFHSPNVTSSIVIHKEKLNKTDTAHLGSVNTWIVPDPSHSSGIHLVKLIFIVCGLHDAWYNSLHVQHFSLLQFMCNMLTNYWDCSSHNLRNQMVRVQVGTSSKAEIKHVWKTWARAEFHLLIMGFINIPHLCMLFQLCLSGKLSSAHFMDSIGRSRGGNFHYFQRFKEFNRPTN